MDLAYPLSSVRYSARLKAAKDTLKRAIFTSQNPTARTVYLGGGRGIQNLASLAQQHGLAPEELKAYEKQVASIKALETGVYAFNSKLYALTGKHGDGVVKLAKLLTPELLKRLVLTSHRLKRGAATYQVPFMTSWQSDGPLPFHEGPGPSSRSGIWPDLGGDLPRHHQGQYHLRAATRLPGQNHPAKPAEPRRRQLRGGGAAQSGAGKVLRRLLSQGA